jgi:Mg-chelatase subunit ChlD
MGTAFGDSHLDLGAPSISVDFEEVSGNVARGLNVFGGGEMRDPWQVVAGSEAPAKEKQIHPADAQLSAKFFDSEAYGLDFVFIVDNSGSMSGQPLAHAKEELFAAVSRLDPKQNFYVFFFNSHCIPMFHGLGAEAAKQCVPANKTNIQLLHRWLKFMPAGGGTDPSEAVALSLAMRPDAIFLLTDGAFNDAHRTEQVLIEHNLIRPAVDGRKAHVPIHTIGFYNWAAEPELAAIAKECGGTYRFIPRPVLPLLPLVPRR